MPKSLTEKAFLKKYDIHDYDVPLVSVDIAVFTIKDMELHALLLKRDKHPEIGKWALPGGFINLTKDATLADTARRKLFKKTGVDTPYLEQVESVGNAERDPRGWSITITYFALIPFDDMSTDNIEKTEETCWTPISTMDGYQLAFDHEALVARCLDRLKSKVQYTSLPINFLPAEFTLTELQTTFEIILGTSVEKKSFRRRITAAHILEDTGTLRKGKNRPAKLYKVKADGDRHFFPRIIEGNK